ncbi:MAG: type II toxin-antitoxin system HicB family antitoxin [Bacteroidota bacterium]|nr:type II toxin-antitoxin system HicB family antitoxin [Bacteroidota bacterium]MDP4230854.1 type II toxin-antitoxin system HicB family antitoxin [Bacteroidota bacterium]
MNAGVSSFGETKDEAVANLKEAVELYFEGEQNPEYTAVDLIELGAAEVYA